MKRSEINRHIKHFINFCRKKDYYLPNFNLKSEKIIKQLIDRQLGWDITDFGSSQFEKIGLSLFTIRNGNPNKKKYYSILRKSNLCFT